MLKTTYRKAEAAPTLGPLPADWTEHKAPTGHTYYYNAETKQSTYTRPVTEPEELQIDFSATEPDRVTQASFRVLDEFHKQNPVQQRGQGQFTGGRSYQDRSTQNRHQDRPKSKKAIINCEPWILVSTKFKRRFVHNTETKESLWKFPSDVMMAVIEMEKVEWQAKQEGDRENDKNKGSVVAPPPATQATEQPSIPQDGAHRQQDYDSDEYEEVEVTDDEGDGESAAKRLRVEDEVDTAPKGPVDFDEDDIAWQLAQAEQDDYGEEAYEDGEGAADEEEGLPLTSEDTSILFRSLLDDMRINPYSPFETLLEASNAAMLEDDRWVVLPNMSARRTVFTEWSNDRIAQAKAREAVGKKQDPRAAYLSFLQDHATPKLYWPEFKRKFKKEHEMKDLSMSDKDREKLYREYIPKIKGSESDRKRDFVQLLKSITPGDLWNQRTTLDELPDSLIQDLRFYVIRDRKTRDELLEAHISTLKS